MRPECRLETSGLLRPCTPRSVKFVRKNLKNSVIARSATTRQSITKLSTYHLLYFTVAVAFKQYSKQINQSTSVQPLCHLTNGFQ